MNEKEILEKVGLINPTEEANISVEIKNLFGSELIRYLNRIRRQYTYKVKHTKTKWRSD